MATVLDLSTAALQDLGVLAANESPPAADANYCLSTLNRLVDQWAAERLMMYAVTRSTWAITSGDGSYTIGSGGNINIPWPVYVQNVQFVDESTDAPYTEYPMSMLTDDAWAAVPQKDLESNLPTCWYLDRAYALGLGNLRLWPIPTNSDLVGVIYAATQVSEFTALTQTVYLPPGYRELIVTALAARIAPAFNQTGMVPALNDVADKAKRIVKTSNTRILDMSFDSAVLPQGGRYYFDIYSGQ